MKIYVNKVASLAVFWAAFMMSSTAQAITAEDMEMQRIQDRMSSIEKQMATMQRELYRNTSRKKEVSNDDYQIGTDDERARQLNGKIEELEHSVNVLAAKLDKIISDIDFRISALEKQGSTPVQAQGPVDISPKLGSSEVVNNDKIDAKERANIRYDQAIELIKREKYEDAERAFKDFIDENKDSDLISNAYYWLAETFYIRKNYQQASIYFLEGYKALPKGNKAADNLLKLAMSLKGMDKKKEACATLDKLKSEFSRGDKDLIAKAKSEQEVLKCK